MNVWQIIKINHVLRKDKDTGCIWKYVYIFDKEKRGKESSCQQICPAGQDMEINRFFLSSKI